MHAIRRAARRDAWFHNEEEQNRTYNPFGRSPRNSKSTRLRTDDGGPSVLSTLDQVTLSPVQLLEDVNIVTEKNDGVPQDRITKSSTKVSDGIAGGLPQDITNYDPEAAEAKPRRRNLRDLLHPGRTEDDDANEIQRTTDSEKAKHTKWNKNPDITIRSQIKATLFGSWFNLLFPFVPAGFAVNYSHRSAIIIFCINFVAIIPSSALLAYSVEEIKLYLGETSGNLLSMTFGNLTQVISSILLLQTRQIRVFQSSLLGSILQNLLVMTGVCFLLPGLPGSRYEEQYFNADIARTIGMLLLLAVMAILMPTASRLLATISDQGLVIQSRGSAVVIMISYGLWLFFQFRTHRKMFEQPHRKAAAVKRDRREPGDMIRGLASIGAGAGAAAAGGQINQTNLVQDDEEEPDLPQLTIVGALTSIVVCTVLVAFNVEFATDSIQNLLTEHNLSPVFMGLVILPILSNDTTCIPLAMDDKMDSSIALTLERCMQTALMVVPLVVIIAWGMGVNEMTLEFDGFSVAALFASIVIVTYVVQEGKSNWLTGALLIKVFVIIGLASYFIR